MDFKEILSLIENGESKTIEFKKSMAEIEKLGKSLCGMLNVKNGYGFIGITDAKKIIGAEVTDSTRKKLSEFLNYFDPWPPIEIEYIQLPNTDKYVIVFICTSSKENAPYTFRGRAYIKTEAGVECMPAEKYKLLLLEYVGLSKAWEAMNASDYTIADLDHDEIIKTIKIALKEGRIPEEEYTENVNEILIQFDLIQNNVLNNAAIVLFSKKIPAEYSQCFIRMGRFTDNTMDNALDSKQMRGNAFQLLSEAQNFVRRHIPIATRYDPNQFERIEEAALPLLAIREAIINAICHRDYSKPSGDISLLIFNDCLEIHNIGHLYGGLTVEQLSQKHPSRRRNERIAQVFFARRLIDRWGGGTSRILRLCAESGLPTPLFSEESDGFLVRLFFKAPIGTQPIKPPNRHVLKERETEILQILAVATDTSLSLQSIRDRLKHPPASRTVGDNLMHLKVLGLINSKGTGRGAKWFLVDNTKNNGADNGAEKS